MSPVVKNLLTVNEISRCRYRKPQFLDVSIENFGGEEGEGGCFLGKLLIEEQ